MKLQAVFWDYPQFLDEKYLIEFIKKNQESDVYFWIMNRFLEHGRVVDTFRFFNINEISKNFQKHKLTDYSIKKWKRLIEVYTKS